MNIDPHSVQVLLEKVRTTLRCPQCLKKVPVAFESLKIMADHFAVLHLPCETCGAHIVLHASFAGVPPHAMEALPAASGSQPDPCPDLRAGSSLGPASAHNISTTLRFDEEELRQLRASIASAEGSFQELFEAP